MPIGLQKRINGAMALPRREENVRPDLLHSMPLPSKFGDASKPLGRRSVLGLGAALPGSRALSARAGRAEPVPASPPADAPWSQSIGAGVVDRPYGEPADFEAGRLRRDVP